MSPESGRAHFIKHEVEALVGKTFETLVTLPSVPQGASGLVVAIDHQSGNWLVVIKWERRHRRRRDRGLYSWFTKAEMQQFLREVSP